MRDSLVEGIELAVDVVPSIVLQVSDDSGSSTPRISEDILRIARSLKFGKPTTSYDYDIVIMHVASTSDPEGDCSHNVI